MKIVENRMFDLTKVRAMCIKYEYYTSGTNEEYIRMFQKCGLNYSVLDIAKDIFEHSNKEKIMYDGDSEKEILESICFNLINECTYTLVNIEV